VASIEVRLIDGDILSTAVELVCFKHAQSFYGADAAAVRRLAAAGGGTDADFVVPVGQVRVVGTAGALTAPRAAFVGTVPLGDLRYHELRQLAARMLTVGEHEGAGSIATTVHGVQAGLDETEAVLALVGGIIDGFQRGAGGGVREVLIVERNRARVARMRAALDLGLTATAG
jgi:hypothetical protein